MLNSNSLYDTLENGIKNQESAKNWDTRASLEARVESFCRATDQLSTPILSSQVFYEFCCGLHLSNDCPLYSDVAHCSYNYEQVNYTGSWPNDSYGSTYNQEWS